MRLLTITTLFPNAADPKHGIFVETRLKHLLSQYPAIKLTVIAPVPWFPFSSDRFGDYAKFSKVPRQEQRIGAEVFHPRYLVIPKIGMLLTPFFLALSILLCLTRLKQKSIQFDLVDGHYLYPDGIAIALCRRRLRVPFFLTARGTDLNLIPKYALARRLICWASNRARGVITVCEALRQEAIGIGIPAEHVTTLRNGVNLTLFTPPPDRDSLRNQLGMAGHCILSVGHLIERKGNHLIIEALSSLPRLQLYIAGDGPERTALDTLVVKHNLNDRVHFLGSRSQTELVQYYGAADLLVLASSREGWANVLLEAMACGTPVVATRVWGTPEVVQSDQIGRLAERSADSLGEAITQVLADKLNRSQVRQYAEQFDWNDTSEGQMTLFTQAIIES